jgi:acetolactate synthase-1/2/3 large subunit
VKVADVIAEWLAKHTKHVFTISGGADLHIIHAIARRDDIKFICPQNEQAAGFMADAYARITGFGCALVTSGPGATSLVTPLAAAYYDSVPVLYLTGNQTVPRLQTFGTRQFGFQATPIVEIVKPITKWAATVMEPGRVLEALHAAVAFAKHGRPGPVLVDIPDDVQRAEL